MTEVPEDYKRVTEEQVDAILKRQLSSPTALASWLFAKAFPKSKLLSVERTSLHNHQDHRTSSGDPLAYGETDVEVVATVSLPERGKVRVGLLIEDKVDARQADQQGPRYQARAVFRQQTGSWDEFRCILVAPQRYLDNAYPSGDFLNSGWDALVAFEELANVIRSEAPSSPDAQKLIEAAEAANAWNKPIPSAVQFWKDLSVFQRAYYPDVPIFADPQQGARINVWPSFYENQLRNNKREVRRKRIQLVHSGKTHVSLFIKNVKHKEFAPVVANIIEPSMIIGAEGQSWQSIQIRVPPVDACLGVESQSEKLDEVFQAARRLYEFFIKNENVSLSIPTFR